MTTKQLNKLTMYLAVEGICDGTPSAWQSLQAFADAYTDLKTRVTNIQTFAQSQMASVSLQVWRYAATSVRRKFISVNSAFACFVCFAVLIFPAKKICFVLHNLKESPHIHSP